MNKKREYGAMSLLLCIILPTILLVFNIVLKGSSIRLQELDYIRAAKSQLEVAKASYNRRLWREFGLLGTNPKAVSFSSTEQLSLSSAADSLKLEYAQSLYSLAELRRQIQRHMNLRAEVLLAETIITRYRKLHNFFGKGITDSLGKALVNLDTTNPQQLLDNPPIVEELPEIIDETGEKHPIDLQQVDQVKALAPIQELLDECRQELLPTYAATAIIPDKNVTSSHKLVELANFVDKVLDCTGFLPDNIALQEYVLHYFTAAVTKEQAEQITYLQTPDGRLHEDLVKAGRRYEVEQIITGKNDPQQAFKYVKNMLKLSCLGYRLLQHTTDSTLRDKHLVTATTISTTVSILSLGTIVIPPSALQYLLALLAAIRDAKRDVADLVIGKCFEINLFEQRLRIYYRDFLRVFMFLYRSDTLIENIARMLPQIIPGDFYTQFIVKGNFAGRELSLKHSYGE